MSTMKFSRKPPLAKSPVRMRPPRVPRSTTSMSVQTPPGFLNKYAVPEIGSISFEIRALARMARGNIESDDKTTALSSIAAGVNKSPLFVRGRFYDLYSAKRNERLLKRKLGMATKDNGFKKCSNEYDFAATIGSKRQSTKRLESGRKSIAVDFLVDRNQTWNTRYSLRSSAKENKKPLVSMSFDKSNGVDFVEMKSVTNRRVVRRI